MRLRRIHTVKRRLANGAVTIHYYHRARMKKLSGRLGSPDFLASYAAAEKVQLTGLGATFAQLVRKFKDSVIFSSAQPRRLKKSIGVNAKSSTANGALVDIAHGPGSSP